MKKIDFIHGRFYNYRIVSYLPIDSFLQYLQNKDLIKHYAYIKHDRCKLDNGEDERVHYHILVSYRNARTVKAVRRDFGELNTISTDEEYQNSLVQVSCDVAEDFVYLDHRFEKDERKAKYNYTDICSNDLSYYEYLSKKGEVDDKTVQVINDIIARVPPRVLLVRYGRDIVMNYDKYKAFAKLIELQNVHLVNTDGEIVKTSTCDGNKQLVIDDDDIQ